MKFLIFVSLVIQLSMHQISIAGDVSSSASDIEVITVSPNYVLLDSARAADDMRSEVASKAFWKREFLETVKLLIEDQEAGRALQVAPIIDVGAIEPSENRKVSEKPTPYPPVTVEAGAI